MNLSPEFFYLYNVSYPQDNCCVILVLVYSSSGYTAIQYDRTAKGEWI